MTALRKTASGVGHLELCEVPIPVPGPGEVRMRVWAAGICGSDLLIEDDRHFYEAPVTIGHEYSGLIDEVGPGVTEYSVGDAIAADIETDNGWLGVTRDGACAPFMIVPQTCLYRYPPEVPLDHVCLTEPVVAIIHALRERSTVSVGDSVVIVGPGPMGLLGVQYARQAGASLVALVGLPDDTARLAIGKDLGANLILTTDDDVVAAVREATHDRGADVVLDASASAEGLQTAIECARRSPEGRGGRGVVVTISLWGSPITLTLDSLPLQQLDVRGAWSWNGPETWNRAVDLITSGAIDIDRVVTGHYRLDQWQEAFAALRNRSQLKVYLHPDPEWAGLR